jgi:hypothetical protein
MRKKRVKKMKTPFGDIQIKTPKIFPLGTKKGAMQRLGLLDEFGNEVIHKPIKSIIKNKR